MRNHFQTPAQTSSRLILVKTPPGGSRFILDGFRLSRMHYTTLMNKFCVCFCNQLGDVQMWFQGDGIDHERQKIFPTDVC